MAHYAFINTNNIVQQVIAGHDEDYVPDPETLASGVVFTDWETYYTNVVDPSGTFGLTCKRTSYNSCAGTHPSGNHCCYRKNYAGIGYSYNQEKDAFIPPKPYNSWVLNDDTCCWKAPIEQPEAVSGVIYVWDEDIVNWKSVEIESL
tara:strand:+ start:151 stop:591 length:441 start_codon:yes stop_codon:yes gene_type:complete